MLKVGLSALIPACLAVQGSSLGEASRPRSGVNNLIAKGGGGGAARRRSWSREERGAEPRGGRCGCGRGIPTVRWCGWSSRLAESSAGLPKKRRRRLEASSQAPVRGICQGQRPRAHDEPLQRPWPNGMARPRTLASSRNRAGTGRRPRPPPKSCRPRPRPRKPRERAADSALTSHEQSPWASLPWAISSALPGASGSPGKASPMAT